MERKIIKIDYIDTDKSSEIELYGLKFNMNLKELEESKNIDTEDANAIDKQLEKVLGLGSIEKINNKRIEDGHEELNLLNKLNIFGCLFEAYSEIMKKNTISKINKSAENINREQRRYNNKNQYRGNRRNYRRY